MLCCGRAGRGMGFVGVGRGGHRGKPVGSGYSRMGSAPTRPGQPRAGVESRRRALASPPTRAARPGAATGGFSAKQAGGGGFSFGSRSRLEGRERRSCGERTSWGTARAGWAPAPGWARGEEGDAVCRHRGPMVLNRVDHDVLGCLGRWVGGHRSPGAARPAGRRATAATAAAAAAAQVRASQGQPVCTAQESTWWYPLPAKARAV